MSSRSTVRRRFDKSRTAIHLDLLRSLAVVLAERLTAIPRRLHENGHCILQTLRASGSRAAGECYAEREVVYVTASRGGRIGNGVGEAVVSVCVCKAAGVVERRVGDEAVVCLYDHGVLHLEVGATS